MTDFVDHLLATVTVLTGLLLLLTIGGWLAERHGR